MTRAQHSLYNPEAGSHPLPEDSRECEAALRAGRRCYDDYPYFAERYGTRGEAFARSDGGYLVTLGNEAQSYVDGQVMWLAGVLACRGMPRWLMEVHLDYLYQELVAARPAREGDYRKLKVAAQALREERQATIAQADFAHLAAAFESASGMGFRNAGGLLVAAVCDEANGLGEAVPSLVSWLGDPNRFPPPWCTAVADTLAQARTLAAKSVRRP